MRTNLLVLLGVLLYSGSTYAQRTTQKMNTNSKVKVHIEKELNGKKTVIDTTFEGADSIGYRYFMDANQMKVMTEKRKGKDGKSITKEVVVNLDENNKDMEREMTISTGPQPPMPPMPPMPPAPPTPPSLPGIDSEVAFFNFNIAEEERNRLEGNTEKLVRIKRLNDGEELNWNSHEIDEILKDAKSSRRIRKNKNAKKRVIIIEEY